MRVLLINWAPLARGTALGGGVNGYVQQVALELAARGHQVAYLSSGQTYVPGGAGGIGLPVVRRLGDYEGIATMEVVNSPVVSPGPCQHDEPGAEVSSPVLEAEFGRLLDVLTPDVVHFHNIEGFSAGCVARAAGHPSRPVTLFSLHNYHTICAQAYLMRGGRTPCASFEGGAACATCIGLGPAAAERANRAEAYARAFPRPAPPPPPTPVQPLGVRLRLALSPAPMVEPPAPAPIPMPGGGAIGWAEGAGPGVAGGGADEEGFEALDNTPRGDAPGDGTGHGRRRAAMVAALSGCSRVLAVSEFVRDKFVAMGVARERVEALTIGTKMTDLAAGCPECRGPVEGFESGRPIRLAFMGYHNRYKGLHVLAAALERLPVEVRGRFHLAVHALGVGSIRPRLEALGRTLAGLRVRDGYAYEDVPLLVGRADAGVVPSVWWDNGPQTVMEFLACGVPVIGARAGGIPDFVRDGENGRLFTGNDPDALAGVLAGVAREPRVLMEWRRGVRSPKSMPSHVDELVARYARP